MLGFPFPLRHLQAQPTLWLWQVPMTKGHSVGKLQFSRDTGVLRKNDRDLCFHFNWSHPSCLHSLSSHLICFLCRSYHNNQYMHFHITFHTISYPLPVSTLKVRHLPVCSLVRTHSLARIGTLISICGLTKWMNSQVSRHVLFQIQTFGNNYKP